jgi:hypothetical protein
MLAPRVVAEGKFICYLRVSTDKHGRSGLGIEAQRSMHCGIRSMRPYLLLGNLHRSSRRILSPGLVDIPIGTIDPTA